MLDINLIRSNPEYVKEALKKREYDVDFTEMLAWDARRKELLMENENLKAERNRMNKEIPMLKKQGKDVSEVLIDPEDHGRPGEGNGRRSRVRWKRRSTSSCWRCPTCPRTTCRPAERKTTRW